MQKKQVLYTTRGMNRDLANSKVTTEFAFENMNLRITPTDDNTLFTLVNEKGNLKITPTELGNLGNGLSTRRVLGYTVIYKTIVLFMQCTFLGDNTIYDCISSIVYDNEFKETFLFKGNLGFSLAHPIETLPLYESENIQKVYWVDGTNQPRVINIKGNIHPSNSTQFDFVVSIAGTESVNISRESSYSGMFPGGTLQYCITYSKKNGQESKIAWASQLIYTTLENRAVAPDEIASGAYKLNLTGIDTMFDYINIYSILKTSEQGTPIVKLVTQIPISIDSTSYSFIDTNTTGEIIDSTALLFIGGNKFIAGTITSKDNTLFLGNLKIPTNTSTDAIKSAMSTTPITISQNSYDTIPDWKDTDGYVQYKNPLIRKRVTHLKSGNKYRIGVQFMDREGVWSEPIYVNDILATAKPSLAGTDLRLPKIALNIPSNVRNAAAANFIKVRPIIVYPEEWERGVIAQGIVCPTVFRGSDRANNSPYAQSSWFFRPYYNGLTTTEHSVENRHLMSLAQSNKYNSEIQYMDSPSEYCAVNNDSPMSKFTSSNNFYIDGSLLTFHSPDINDSTLDSNISNSNLAIVGAFSMDSWAGRYNITSQTFNIILPGSPVIASGNIVDKNIGELSKSILDTDTRGIFATSSLSHIALSGMFTAEEFGAVYPWHNQTTLYSIISDPDFSTATKEYDYKVFSNIRSSQTFGYFTSDSEYILPNGLKSKRIFRRSMGEAALQLNIPDNFNLNSNAIYYTGSYNKLIPPTSYKIAIAGTFNESLSYKQDTSATSGVWIQYSSDTHAVLQLGNNDILPTPAQFDNTPLYNGYPFWLKSESTVVPYTVGSTVNMWFLPDYEDHSEEVSINSNIVTYEFVDGKPVFRFLWKDYDGNLRPLPGGLNPSINGLILPTNSNQYKYQALTDLASYRDRTLNVHFIALGYYQLELDSQTSHVDVLNLPSNVSSSHEVMWITELRRSIPDNIFGGNSPYAIKNNKWVPCGEAVGVNSNTIYITEGDTIFSRWDCLKTLPLNTTNKNQIVEVMSFMCESYINTAGRYDKNKDQLDYTYLNSTTEFNLINSAYNNRNDYFSYRILDTDTNRNINFPSQVTWSLAKTLGESIDSWTNISLASVLDLDGDKGEVRALRRYKNSILSFQDKGIAEILFNSSTAISSSTGVPIELANSGKVDGKRYISESIGCTNKWSICITSKGVYFVDNIQKKIYLLSDGIRCISDELGFESWLHNNLFGVSEWSPQNFNDIITQYDRTVGDVYFITKDKCLAFNEMIDRFSSFYSYEKTPFFINLDDKCISINTSYNELNTESLWLQHSGEYNSFFGAKKPYYSEIIVNENPIADKVFTNLDFRADSWNLLENEWNLTGNTFDQITAWNEYQSGIQKLTFNSDLPSSLKRKFRVWRAQLPRDTEHNSRDRIRNTWAHIRLSKIKPLDEKTQLHDMVVTYYV